MAAIRAGNERVGRRLTRSPSVFAGPVVDASGRDRTGPGGEATCLEEKWGSGSVLLSEGAERVNQDVDGKREHRCGLILTGNPFWLFFAAHSRKSLNAQSGLCFQEGRTTHPHETLRNSRSPENHLTSRSPIKARRRVCPGSRPARRASEAPCVGLCRGMREPWYAARNRAGFVFPLACRSISSRLTPQRSFRCEI